MVANLTYCCGLVLLLLSACRPLPSTPLQLRVAQAGALPDSQQVLQARFGPPQAADFNPGFTRHTYWITTTVHNHGQGTRVLLLLNNPHINHAEAWQVGKGPLATRLGDYFPFASRPYYDRDLIIPISMLPGDSAKVLLWVNKANESLQLRLEALTPEELEARRRQEHLFMGFSLGWLVLIAMFAVFLWAGLRHRANLLYALYVVVVVLWMLSNWGLGFQYLWPAAPGFASKARPVFALLGVACFTSVLLSFFPPGQRFRWLTRTCRWYMALMLVLAAGSLLINYSSLPDDTKVPFLQLLSACTVAGALLSSLYLWYQWAAGEKLVLYYVVAICFLLLTTVSINLYQFGITNSFTIFLNTYGSAIGLMGETAILSMGFARRVSLYKKEKEDLALHMLLREKQMAEQMIAVEEAERTRLGRDLHDSIGSMLATIHLHASQLQHQHPQVPLQPLQHMLQQSMAEARAIAHNLVPPHLAQHGLRSTLLQLVQQHSQPQCRLSLYYDWHGQLPLTMQTSVYRICVELISNILRHADATEGSLQLTEDEGQLQVLAEDNGSGFDSTQPSHGIGLQNLRSRIAYLKGSLHIDSNKDGTTIIILLPIPI
ncbi:MAG: histidine kinase [Chitinophagaceae bacterium]|nr:histidine kinase [Chitinophagaceae bacterium]